MFSFASLISQLEDWLSWIMLETALGAVYFLTGTISLWQTYVDVFGAIIVWVYMSVVRVEMLLDDIESHVRIHQRRRDRVGKALHMFKDGLPAYAAKVASESDP